MTRRLTHGQKAPASSGARFGHHVAAVMAEQPLRFTLEADAVQDAEWRIYVDELVALDQECDRISVAPTTGAARKTSTGGTPEGEANTAVVDSVEGVTEVFGLDLAELDGDPQLVRPSEADVADRIARALTGNPFIKLRRPKRENVSHLATHARHHRDVFVTSDSQTLAKRDRLVAFGIRVEDPQAALDLAREHCSGTDRPRSPDADRSSLDRATTS